jgi:mannose-6-phosphate isomerase-like protein (cupin superfamily)
VSYPPPRHLAETGEVSARLRPRDAPPDLVTGTTSVHYLATGAATEGEFGLYRWDMTGPGGPDPHFHRTMSESFFVLSGAVRLYDGRRWVDGGPGDFLHVPVGGIHAFRNASGAPASMLLLFAPGAPREAYFEGLAEIAASGRELSDEERTEFLRRHDQYMV